MWLTGICYRCGYALAIFTAERAAMLSSSRLPAQSLLALTIGLALYPLANAAMNKGSSSSRLTWGDVTQGRGNVSTSTNPGQRRL